MSTKIYNGYLFDGSINDLVQACLNSGLNEKVKNIIKRKSANVLGHLFAADLFGYSDLLPDDNPEVKVKVYKKVQQDAENHFLRSAGHGERSPLDFESRLMIKTHPNFKNKTLVGSFIADREIESLAIETLGLKFFGYWNNSDRPEELSSAQWKRREQIWECALGDKSWIDAGFLSLELQPPKVANLFDLLDSPKEVFNEIIDAALKHQIREFILDICLDNLQSPLKENKSLSHFMRLSKEFKNWLRTDEKATSLLQKFEAQLLESLPKIGSDNFFDLEPLPGEFFKEIETQFKQEFIKLDLPELKT